jgi:hypothetical protein
MEQWKVIPNFPNYLVSDMGQIKSINARKGSRTNINDGIINGWVQTCTSNYSRRLVALRKDGKTYCRKVHQLVLEAFVGPRPTGMITLHQNGDSLDNRLCNLCWGTYMQNHQDTKRHNSYSKPPVRYGESHHAVTIPSEDVAKIRAHIFKRGDQVAMAKHYGVNPITISRIKAGLSRITE